VSAGRSQMELLLGRLKTQLISEPRKRPPPPPPTPDPQLREDYANLKQEMIQTREEADRMHTAFAGIQQARSPRRLRHLCNALYISFVSHSLQ
jgi:hypothetical protein